MNATLPLDHPAATEALAARLAPHLRPGDIIALTGGLGAGKSLFARAVIRERLPAARGEDIPSPTYTLVQTYDLGDAELWHADLYRLGDIGEVAELGLDEAFASAICLVEWAERLGPLLPARHLGLDLAFVPGDPDARRATLDAAGGGWDWLPGALDGRERPTVA